MISASFQVLIRTREQPSWLAVTLGAISLRLSWVAILDGENSARPSFQREVLAPSPRGHLGRPYWLAGRSISRNRRQCCTRRRYQKVSLTRFTAWTGRQLPLDLHLSARAICAPAVDGFGSADHVINAEDPKDDLGKINVNKFGFLSNLLTNESQTMSSPLSLGKSCSPSRKATCQVRNGREETRKWRGLLGPGFWRQAEKQESLESDITYRKQLGEFRNRYHTENTGKK
ncbi:uncharacterized protein LOC143174460 [Nomia melanderi]|uniref:uncharacterized protein LOC143174460 n=1 Tax=Nomia melanderi TaxID=2448451 RepID=UPI003FCD4F25